MDVYGMEKLSLVDYDGVVAATIFTGGCNFRCPFCHNGTLVTDFKQISTIDENEIISYLKKRQGIIEGLCITGGEPTLNPDLPNFIEKVKSTGIKVKLDSNGTNPDMIKSLVLNGLIDHIAIDIKNDKAHYAAIIGFDEFDTSKIEKTVSFLLEGKISYEFRTTLIDEFHDENNLIEIGKWIFDAEKYFLQKFKSGDNCLSPDGLSDIPQDKAIRLLDAVKPYVKSAYLRGYDLSG